MADNDVEFADRLGRQRARMLPLLAIMFLTQQASFFTSRIEDPTRAVDHVRVGAWLLLSVVLLLMLTTGGALIRRRSVRALLNDEVTRANRTEAMRLGFITTMFGGVALYVITFFEFVGGREAIHLVMTIGIATALLRFGILERRAHKGG
ncbi:MAG: hypothetical protein QOC65_593 [Sphingomonadales bacterium]|nr:hypothetical protein [Sphingomonadales bacterium]